MDGRLRGKADALFEPPHHAVAVGGDVFVADEIELAAPIGHPREVFFHRLVAVAKIGAVALAQMILKRPDEIPDDIGVLLHLFKVIGKLIPLRLGADDDALGMELVQIFIVLAVVVVASKIEKIVELFRGALVLLLPLLVVGEDAQNIL